MQVSEGDPPRRDGNIVGVVIVVRCEHLSLEAGRAKALVGGHTACIECRGFGLRTEHISLHDLVQMLARELERRQEAIDDRLP